MKSVQLWNSCHPLSVSYSQLALKLLKFVAMVLRLPLSSGAAGAVQLLRPAWRSGPRPSIDAMNQRASRLAGQVLAAAAGDLLVFCLAHL